MKPDIYLSGEEADYVGYRTPKHYEHFFNKKNLLKVLSVVFFFLLLAEAVKVLL